MICKLRLRPCCRVSRRSCSRWVLLSPDREWTLTELAQQAGSSLATAQREIGRTEEAGLVSTRRFGTVRLVKAAASPLTEPMTELLLRSFGPKLVLAEELAGLSGIEQIYTFGSWAIRHTGQRGHPPADIDVLVIGAPDREDLDDAAQRASARLAREVNLTIRSDEWWRTGTDGFHTEVTSRPLVPVLEPDASATEAES
jgi:predicted nucleotidyltransferase